MSRNGYFAVVVALAAVAGLAASPLASAFNIYTVGGDAACGYAFIQDAIDAAAANPGEDYVWIASNRTYEDQHLVVTDQDVDIEGGFTDCSDFDPGLDQTTIGGTSGHSVFEIEGTSHVYLGNMVITGAVMDASHSGGGIYFGGQGALTLNIDWVFANQAGYGGGIDVSPSGPTTLTLTASTVSANTALASGGGIRIEGPTTLIATHSPSQYNNYISQNAALGQVESTGYGGGIEVLGPAVANFSSVMALNSAVFGGGIAELYSDNGAPTVNVYTTDPNAPATIYGNHASALGGGIVIEAAGNTGATLCMADMALDANVSADYAAAIYQTSYDGTLGPSVFLNRPDLCALPADAVACAPGTACNEINDNVTQLDDGTPVAGDTIYISFDSTFSANRFSARRNRGGLLIDFDANSDDTGGDSNYVHLHNCLLADNVSEPNLVKGINNGAGTQIIVDTCTLTHNNLGSTGQAVIDADVNFVELTNSIVDQPGLEPMQFRGPPGDLTSRYVLTDSAVSLSGGDGIVVGAPTFVDAAGGDYHLAPTSMGIDMAPALDGTDLDGNPRTVDQTGIPDMWGPLDVGAYEIQEQIEGCSAQDTVFCNGFDGL